MGRAFVVFVGGVVGVGGCVVFIVFVGWCGGGVVLWVVVGWVWVVCVL